MNLWCKIPVLVFLYDIIHYSMKWLNVPNSLIILRLLCVPVIILLLLLEPEIYLFKSEVFNISPLSLSAFFLFLFACMTDFFDGWYARKFKKVTDFGKFFDPIVDKILVDCTFIVLGVIGITPVWMVMIFVARDIYVDGLRMWMASNNIVSPAKKTGKLKTLFTMLTISMLIICMSPSGWFHTTAIIIELIAVCFTLYSAGVYTRDAFSQKKRNE